MIRCVLVATDGSTVAAKAVRTATELVQSLGSQARLHIVAIVAYAELPVSLTRAPAGAPDLLADQAEVGLEAGVALARADGVEADAHLLRGDLVETLMQCAADVHADLLVVGAHGRGGLQRLVLGSTAARIVRASHIPVVVVREKMDVPGDTE